jgi:hypothetical protein
VGVLEHATTSLGDGSTHSRDNDDIIVLLLTDLTERKAVVGSAAGANDAAASGLGARSRGDLGHQILNTVHLKKTKEE